jgi:hypothetical protein
MRMARISYSREFEMPIFYHNEQIGTRRVDFLVEGVISVELKGIEPHHTPGVEKESL